MDTSANPIVICGLGRLGQACLNTLENFGIPLRCLALTPPLGMEAARLSALMDILVIGDMRQSESLIRAGVRDARAVLLLSSNSGVNLEAALQVRLLNADARVVVRSTGGKGLELHLRERLPGLALVDPELLTAGVFANALRPDGSEAAFSVGGELFRVVRNVLDTDSPEDLFSLQARQRRLLQCCPAHHGPPGPPASQWWDLDSKPQAGDQLFWLESTSGFESRLPGQGSLLQDMRARWVLALEGFQDGLRVVFRRWPRGAPLGAGLVSIALAIGINHFGFGSPLRGLLLTIALLKGEYIDALSAMTGGGPLSADHLDVATLGLFFALSGTFLTAWLVGVVLDWLLARRLGRREPGPLAAGTNFILVVGGDRLAKSLEKLLWRSRFRVRRVQVEGEEGADRCFASLDRALRVMRHCRCQGVAVLGHDLMANLETALSLQKQWPQARLAIQSHTFNREGELKRFFPGIEVIHPLELAAGAVVATAFGERVREVIRVAETNLLLTDYRIEEGDTLVGRSIGQISEGYGVMPVSLTLSGQTTALMLPGLDRVLQQGDSLIVLGALPGLRAVEVGLLKAPAWRLELKGIGVGADRFVAQMLLARHLNRPPGEMAAYLDTRMGHHLTPPLHQEQGRELEAALRRLGIQCCLIGPAQS
ncbi:MAG: NAD-binding protein [Cyanobacteriota bacterium]|nr:NAD-binding protein [Cyanobacteriota bacterium]